MKCKLYLMSIKKSFETFFFDVPLERHSLHKFSVVYRSDCWCAGGIAASNNRINILYIHGNDRNLNTSRRGDKVTPARWEIFKNLRSVFFSRKSKRKSLQTVWLFDIDIGNGHLSLYATECQSDSVNHWNKWRNR